MTQTRKTLTLTLDLEGAAFADGFGDLEVGAILRRAADRIGAGALNDRDDLLAVGHSIPLLDSNGNVVGQAEVVQA